MSLLRLLSTGKSLMGLADTPHRYQLARRSLLPKFASKQNPFRSRITPSLEKAISPGPAPAGPATPASSQPASAAPAARPAVAGAPVAGSAHGLVARSANLLGGLFPKRSPAAAHPRRDTGKPMVQGELSLERVTVVRNDLSDSDLEVVVARPAAQVPGQAPTAQTPTRSVGGRLGRLGLRLFGAGRS